jgi:hypothetical protein
MSKKEEQPTYYGGMTYKQFRNAGKVGLWMNDLAWAGRLFSKIPYWWGRMSMVVWVALAICILSLGGIWASILLRPPVLLLGVYPDGRVICMPRVLDQQGHRVARHKSYNKDCATLFSKAGLEWVVEQSRQAEGRMPSTDPMAEKEDPRPEFRAPTTTTEYIQKTMRERQTSRQRAAVNALNAQTAPPSPAVPPTTP